MMNAMEVAGDVKWARDQKGPGRGEPRALSQGPL
jgi:hypothetical protein